MTVSTRMRAFSALPVRSRLATSLREFLSCSTACSICLPCDANDCVVDGCMDGAQMLMMCPCPRFQLTKAAGTCCARNPACRRGLRDACRRVLSGAAAYACCMPSLSRAAPTWMLRLLRIRRMRPQQSWHCVLLQSGMSSVAVGRDDAVPSHTEEDSAATHPISAACPVIELQ